MSPFILNFIVEVIAVSKSKVLNRWKLSLYNVCRVQQNLGSANQGLNQNLPGNAVYYLMPTQQPTGNQQFQFGPSPGHPGGPVITNLQPLYQPQYQPQHETQLKP
ncbi:hypothetical protein CspeluHIS016_0600390 [Cutaneotrichosporon spelunceum]|uniref:Uncharacterized protein n=1 Tax=Cutaneotrichosporon spelunceum TaxID=1672016 RepID=A0AAD3YE40_9TREE|nr:hypothetical protein CspeluHIS016_0600390 [Cutaneotrichosporon spelunceum]